MFMVNSTNMTSSLHAAKATASTFQRNTMTISVCSTKPKLAPLHLTDLMTSRSTLKKDQCYPLAQSIHCLPLNSNHSMTSLMNTSTWNSSLSIYSFLATQRLNSPHLVAITQKVYPYPSLSSGLIRTWGILFSSADLAFGWLVLLHTIWTRFHFSFITKRKTHVETSI